MAVARLRHERCPYCDGTGKRPIPPPPDSNGGQKKGGRRHGFEATYQAGCHCLLCRRGHAAYAKRRKAKAKLSQARRTVKP